MDSTNRHMVLAVVEADRARLSRAAGLTPGWHNSVSKGRMCPLA